MLSSADQTAFNERGTVLNIAVLLTFCLNNTCKRMQPSNPQLRSSSEMPDVDLFVKMSDGLITPSPMCLYMILSAHSTTV